MASLCGLGGGGAAAEAGNCEFLMLGLEGCGKTLLTRRLQCLYDRVRLNKFMADTVPTTGTEVNEVNAGRHAPFRKLAIRELGGSMCPIWPDYYGDCKCVLFVVDVSDNASLAPATVELYELLQHVQLKDKPCLVVLNKCDAPVTVSRTEVELVMALSELERMMGSAFSVVEVSALSGHETGAVLDWMVARKCELLGLDPPPSYLMALDRQDATLQATLGADDIEQEMGAGPGAGQGEGAGGEGGPRKHIDTLDLLM